MKTVVELNAMNAGALRTMLKEEFGVESGISRTPKAELVAMVMEKQKATKKKAEKVPTKPKPEASTEEKVNKSDILRKEIRRRARADQSLNSGPLMEYMKEKHQIEMSRQFVVNVRNRYLKACPELLNA